MRSAPHSLWSVLTTELPAQLVALPAMTLRHALQAAIADFSVVVYATIREFAVAKFCRYKVHVYYNKRAPWGSSFFSHEN